ncbi:MAG TPA: 6-phosphogluconolactonase [Candidatus Saccharimonadales bacterium]|nr:6-phosphogluconolactonase [Candidatus Saccharimonadales bacterium]
MKKWELIPCASDLAVANLAADEWVQQLPSPTAGPYLTAFSGGRIAKHFLAATAAKLKGRDYSHLHFFWADERCVPPENPDSNFLLAQESLFNSSRIEPNQIHRIHGEDDPHVAANKATMEIKHLAPASREGLPVLDMLFLGMGEDGHVASLFPGGAPEEPGAIYYPVIASKPPPNRITMSYGVLAAARAVWVLASGEGKSDALKRSLHEGSSTPLGRVLQGRSMTRIFTDVQL